MLFKDCTPLNPFLSWHYMGLRKTKEKICPKDNKRLAPEKISPKTKHQLQEYAELRLQVYGFGDFLIQNNKKINGVKE